MPGADREPDGPDENGPPATRKRNQRNKENNDAFGHEQTMTKGIVKETSARGQRSPSRPRRLARAQYRQGSPDVLDQQMHDEIIGVLLHVEVL
jgi:hypothetical protein